LAQVLQNLISNAIKYRGTDPPRIHLEARRQGNVWVFSVSDNGIGIEEQFSQQIFGLFKRLHTQAQYEGTGMGLAICQRIVEQYGGRIWLANSAPGKGSTFCFSIPIQPLS
jgi:light-regulated signal transduction histidine kinase (bacteriophytochrome)